MSALNLVKYFVLKNSCAARLKEWLQEQNNIAIEQQRQTMPAGEFRDLTNNGTSPYAGAIGGALTVVFGPMGPNNPTRPVRIEHGLTHNCLDLPEGGEELPPGPQNPAMYVFSAPLEEVRDWADELGVPDLTEFGKQIEFQFTSTSLGIHQAIRHIPSDKTANFTDYASW